jgi:hypothetical protein
MSASEQISHRGSAVRLGIPSERILLATILFAFLILHILAGVMLSDRLAAPIADDAVSLSSFD